MFFLIACITYVNLTLVEIFITLWLLTGLAAASTLERVSSMWLGMSW